MSRSKNLKQSLIEVDDSILVIIDIQENFLNKYDRDISHSLLARSTWIIEIARYFRVPIVAMGEDIDNTCDLHQSIRDTLPENTKIYNKDSFSLAGNPDILAAVKATGRKTAILIGVETDVCVAQSALGLMENGYQVVVLKDAVATTAGDDEIGLSRMREAGAVITSVKALYYEWQRSVTNCEKLRAAAPELLDNKKPGGLAL